MWLDFTEGRPDLDRLEFFFSKDWQQAVLAFLRQWYDQYPVLSVYSSGTTSSLRMFSVKKAHMVSSARMTADFFGLKSGSRALLCLSPDYIAAKMLLVRAAVLGWQLCCVPPSSQPLKGFDASFDFVPMVPLQLAESLADLGRVKILLIGGALISSRLEEALQLCPTACYSSYGMTETLSHVALRRINGTDREQYFRTLPGIDLSLDERGCLRIFAPELMDAPLQTQDLVELVSEDQFIWLGRYDYLINSGGIKIIPEQWEERFRPFVSTSFFIAALPDEILGQKIALFVEGKPTSLEIPEMLFVGKDRFCKPREICFVPQFLWTSSGKIRREKTLQKFIEGRFF
ncbi:MAG: AMP-binding protein [Flavobacteriales bacterium AspAUS03]